MEKNYTKILGILFVIFTTNSFAQCTSCTTTISGADAAPHTVLSGQTLCITAAGNASGNITVATGGTLCNQGTISSSMVWIAGGTYHNYGTQVTDLMTVSSAGSFHNHNNATIDSLLVTGTGSSFNNMGTVIGVRFTVAASASTVNSGSITEDFAADTVGTFTNASTGTFTVNFDYGTGYTSTVINDGTIHVGRDFGNAYNALFTNNGTLTVSRDFLNSYTSTFTNNGILTITRDFYNSTSATVKSNCMATVNRDWYNSATVLGANNPSCGGFNIAGMSLSSGTLGDMSTHLDLCDAGHPVGGIDGNSGTIAVTTTYCTCANACALVGITEYGTQNSSFITSLYPNPSNDNITVKVNLADNNEKLLIEIKNMLGQNVYSQNYQASKGENVYMLSISALPQGTYILSISDAHHLQSKKMFTVVK